MKQLLFFFIVLLSVIFFWSSSFSESDPCVFAQDKLVKELQTSSQKRLAILKSKIDLLNTNLEDVRKLAETDNVDQLLKPYVAPEKPKYPPPPEKKDTASSLKKNPNESDEDFNNRVEHAKVRDRKDFQFEEIAWRLQKQNIDDEFEDKLKKSREQYEAYVQKEKNRLKFSRNELGSLTEQTKNNIQFIYNCINEENCLLHVLQNHTKESPLISVCYYETLQPFNKEKICSSEINISGQETKRKFGKDDYVFNGENVRLKVYFDSWDQARQFKMLSESGKLFILKVVNIDIIESLLNFKGTSRVIFWNDNYRVRDGENLRFLWQVGLDKMTVPPTTLPNTKNGPETEEKQEITVQESTSFPALTPNVGIRKEIEEETTEILDEMNRPGRKTYDDVSKQIPIRYFIGTDKTILTDLRIEVHGDFVVKRISKIIRQERSAGDTLQMNGNILETGKNAGEKRSFIVNGIEYIFCWCPPGKFQMGIKDMHEVTLTRGFWLLETEVTQKMYQDLMGSNPSVYQGEEFPVENVNWEDCLSFCDKLTGAAKIMGVEFKLPTEAQWEYACRAGTTSDYSFGSGKETLYENGNYCDMSNTNGWAWRDGNHNDRYDKTAPVKSYAPNPWGLYDMHGNVWEWCSSRFGTYSKIPETDPVGPIKGTFRVFRGGSWSIGAEDCQSGTRFAFVPAFRRDDLGFRISLTPETTVKTGYIDDVKK